MRVCFYIIDLSKRGSMNRKKIGDRYEDIAADFLREKGYKILKRNFHSRYGEIDIIAYKDGVYVFCEVKYRKNDDYGMPAEFVTKKKQDRIVKTVARYLMYNKFVENYRFDVIGVLGTEINHIENAFVPSRRLINI